MQEMTEKPSGRRGRPGEAQGGAQVPQELEDRLAGLLPADALKDALEGLELWAPAEYWAICAV